MHYSSSFLLVGAIAPLVIATPVPQSHLPVRRSTGVNRSWNGTLAWNNTLSSRSSNSANSTSSSPPANPIILHQTLNKTHPYFEYLSKRGSHSVVVARARANSTVTAKEPIPIATTPPSALPPPKFHPEVFDPSVYTIRHKAREENVPRPTAPAKQNKDKRQIGYSGTGYPPSLPQWRTPQYLPPPPGSNFPTSSGVGGSEELQPSEEQPLQDENEDERARQEGPEASQIPPGHPVPEGVNSPSPAGFDPQAGDAEAESFPLVGNVRSELMTAEQLQRKLRNKKIQSPEDVEEVKSLVRKMTVLEQKQKITKRSDIMGPGEAAMAWKNSVHAVGKTERGRIPLKGMVTTAHREPFAKRDVAVKPVAENSETTQETPSAEQVQDDPTSPEAVQGADNANVEVAVKATDDTKTTENGPYGYGPYGGGGGPYYGPYQGGGPYGYPNGGYGGYNGDGRGGYGYGGRGYKKE